MPAPLETDPCEYLDPAKEHDPTWSVKAGVTTGACKRCGVHLRALGDGKFAVVPDRRYALRDSRTKVAP